MKILTESNKLQKTIDYILDYVPYGIDSDMFNMQGDRLVFEPSYNVKVEFDLNLGKSYLKFDKGFCTGLEYENNANAAYSDMSALKENLEQILEVEDKINDILKYKNDIEDLVGESRESMQELKDFIEDEYEITSDGDNFVIIEDLYKCNIEHNDNSYEITGVELI